MVLISPTRTSSNPSVNVAAVGDDLFALVTSTETLGYVHKVGRVYVALRGSDINSAVEIAQSLSWDRAIDAVCGGNRSAG
jgi:hypothetical protein